MIGHTVGNGFHLGGELSQLVIGNALLIDLHALVESVDKWGCIEARTATRALQNGR